MLAKKAVKNKYPKASRRKPTVAKSVRSSGRLDWSRVRIAGVAIFLGLLWVGLWVRACFVQVVEGPRLAAMAARQHRTSESFIGERGEILDSKGRLLAKSVEIQSVFARPGELEDKGRTIAALSSLLGLNRRELEVKLKSRSNQVWIARQIGDQDAAKVKDAGLKGVYLTTEYGRLYPNKTLAGQLLGFAGFDDQGLEGLESAFDKHLAGRTAKQVVQRDAAGRRLHLDAGGHEVDIKGKDLKLTIDAHIQYVAEEALLRVVKEFNAAWAGCVLVEVETGNILAWSESPPFNPNLFGQYPPQRRRNRMAIDTFEPGSSIKPLVVAAALQEGICEADTLYFCENGKFHFENKIIRDVHPQNWLPVHKIVRYSSNVGSAKIALALGERRLHGYLHRLGFGSRTGLPLPGESKGVLRAPRTWQKIETATTGFGQGFSVTLLQLAKAYLCIANYGVSKPLRLVEYPLDDPLPEVKVFDQRVARKVIGMLRDVVEEDGTGKKAQIEGLSVAGKTSTAQKASPHGGYGNKVVASFIGFLPAENPKYLLGVVVDEPEPVHYGGLVAAPVFREVAIKTLAYLGQLPEIKPAPVVAAAPAGKPAPGAKGTTGGKPAPAPAPAPAETKTVSVRPRTFGKDKVPDVVGLSVRRAVEVFAGQGVVPVFIGEGTVVQRQNPAPGQPWPDTQKDKCTLWLVPDVERS